MNSLIGVPARYAKFITSLAGLFVVYVQMYGLHWMTVPAITAIAAALGVYGVPNAPKPAPPAAPPLAPPGPGAMTPDIVTR